MFTTEDTEDTEFLNKGITEAIIASAICVHKSLGPGLLDPQVITCLKLTGIENRPPHQLQRPFTQGRLKAHFPMIVLYVPCVLCG